MSCSAQLKKKVGGLEPVDPNSPKIIEIANWAVKEHNKEGDCLEFIRIIEAEYQMGSGMKYYIILEATNGILVHGAPMAITNEYFAIVYDKPWNHTRILEVFVAKEQDEPHVAVAN
ncbi:cysteine proteinase inhibitor 1-like isoform X1 [Spinacia oleracea]|uniref:Cysteine proteinase inhibitor 1-like isoform X1 n=1 Tax=Spinacia oleracea TaxID=3562 RepID=A0ABM3RCX8_SPIOL|nr:cysteine proteinase inhibitor 1-like isoform X1 [Spinacia oleracea]